MSQHTPSEIDGPPDPVADVPWWRRPIVVLGLVAAAHAALPVVVLGRHWLIGIDESVYLSQINAHVPPGGFSAPRARGSTFVAAPVTAFTDAIAPMRVWTTLLSGLALFLAFGTWLRLRAGYLVPLAAALFSSIWVVTYYGFQVMPNEWVAFATVGACGSLLSFLLHGRGVSLVVAALALGLTALFRPSDAVFALIAFALVCAACRTTWRRRLVAVAALTAGAVAGAADWVVEAYTTYGGLRHRLHVAEAEQGGAGLHWSGWQQLRVLGGPLLCRTDCRAHPHPLYWAWWAAAAVLIVIAVVLARREKRPVLTLAPLLLGLLMAAQYLLTVPYAAPRFLLPAYAALSLLAAAGLLALVRALPNRPSRTVLAAAFTVAFAAHLTVQLHIITARVAPTSRVLQRQLTATAGAARGMGLRGRCLVLGQTGLNGPLAYRLRCANIRPSRDQLLAQLRDGVRVLWLRDSPPSNAWGYHWDRRRVVYSVPTTAYVSTSTTLRRSSG